MEAVLPLTDGRDPDQLVIAFHANRRGDGQEEEESDGDDESPAVPYYPYGVIFLRRIMLEHVPRMRAGGRSLTPVAFKYIFGATEDEIEHNYYRVGIIPPNAIAANRVVTNKAKRTPTYIPELGTAEPALFALAERGHRLPSPPVNSGSDLEDVDNNSEDEEGIDAAITQLFRQLLIDMMYKVPNPRGVGNPSYCLLNSDERLSVPEELYKNRKLSEIWRACQYKYASREDFELAFDHLFPPRGHQTGPKVQNYLQTRYYIKWKEICDTADPKTIDVIRLEIKKRVMKFDWIPHACQDKMWNTKHLKGFHRYPTGSNGPAPRILFRGRPEL